MQARTPLTPLFALSLAALTLSGCVGDGPTASDQAAGTLSRLEQIAKQTYDKDCPQGELVEMDMWVNEAFEWEPYPGNTIAGMAFGPSPQGPWSVPGPEIRVKQCDTVRVNLHTVGQFSHTIHWHGQSVPWAMDGVAYVTQDVGRGMYTYEFVAKESGTYWYHCHVEAPVHVDAGMYGMFIVEPRQDVDPPFDREYSMMLGAQDPEVFGILFAFDPENSGIEPGDAGGNPFDTVGDAERAARSGADLAGLIAGDATGNYLYSEGPRPYYNEPSLRYRPEYSVFMINGKSFPATEPLMTSEGDIVRVRVVNASPLIHTLHLHGHHFLVTHKDGYPLMSPFFADTLPIAPGERYDLYIESDNPGIWDFHDHGGGWGYGGHASNNYAFPGGMNTMFVYEDFEYADLPGPTENHVSGDYAVFSEAYKGTARPPSGWT